MSVPERITTSIKSDVNNIDGSNHTTVSFSPGITVLAGRNVTNRTSLLQALMTGLGSNNVSLKGDAKIGQIELTIGEETFTRALERTDGTIEFSGDPYLNDATLADLFVFLLEDNETRRAVERADDLQEILMRPVDTAAIEAQIDRLQTKRDNLDQQLEELESLRRKLPDLEQRREQLNTEIDAKRTELQDAEAAIEDAEQDRDTAGDLSPAI